MKLEQAKAIKYIMLERQRQDELKVAGRFEFTLADDGLTNAEKLATITEEVGEVAQCVLASEGLTHDTAQTTTELRRELVQVGALVLAWLEALPV